MPLQTTTHSGFSVQVAAQLSRVPPMWLLRPSCRPGEAVLTLRITHCKGFLNVIAQVATELSRVPPVRLLRPSCRPWEGALTLAGVIARLRDVLPPTFEELHRSFAVSGAAIKRTPV